jgi:3-deoxy-D-manno-octulosonic-acid transferase
MYLLYSLAHTVGFVLLLPYFAYQVVRYGKHKAGLKQRLGWLPQSLETEQPTIWLHAVSVGEFLAALPLIRELKSALPAHRLLVSTTTLTGQTLARTHLNGDSSLADRGALRNAGEPRQLLGGVFYFPLDWRFSVRRVLGRIKPSAVVIIETELWPNFLRECHRRGIPTIIANGRISPGSHRGYRRIRRFIRQVIGDISLLIMQSQEDASRVLSLGADPARVRVCGNLKYDATPEDTNGYARDANHRLAEDLDRLFTLRAAPVVVAGSTAPGEEEILINALGRVITTPGLEATRIVIAPRHPERFDEVARLLARTGYDFVRRSEAVPAQPSRARVVLLDSIGELAALYRFASVVFVGGSLVPRGGHNILEPAYFAKPIIVGQYTENFKQIVSDFAREGALVQIEHQTGPVNGEAMTEAVAGELARLLSDPETADSIGARGRSIVTRNQGATSCTLAAITELLP